MQPPRLVFLACAFALLASAADPKATPDEARKFINDAEQKANREMSEALARKDALKRQALAYARDEIVKAKSEADGFLRFRRQLGRFAARLLRLPEPMARVRESVAARPGFRWVLEMYRRHRGRSAAIAA